MGTPKALLRLRGETFLECLVRKVQDAGCAPVIVVLGHNAPLIRDSFSRADVHFALNPDYSRGMLSSLQTGLRSVPESTSHILFTLVDHPDPAPGTLSLLVRAPEARVVIPRHAGRKGHPVRIARTVSKELLALPADATAKDVLSRHLDGTLFFDLDDPGIVDDIDDPAAYDDLLARTERHL
jgi:CTP:molybdopterin cytidylyltransferase MocA